MIGGNPGSKADRIECINEMIEKLNVVQKRELSLFPRDNEIEKEIMVAILSIKGMIVRESKDMKRIEKVGIKITGELVGELVNELRDIAGIVQCKEIFEMMGANKKRLLTVRYIQLIDECIDNLSMMLYYLTGRKEIER